MTNPIVLHAIVGMLNIPYVWGGNSPLSGWDCSAFVTEILRIEDRIPMFTDFSSQSLYEYLIGQKYKKVQEAKFGDIIFFGANTLSITHVSYGMGYGMMAESAGGDRTTRTIEDAIKRDARSKIRPIRYRKDIVAILSQQTNQ